MSSRVQAGRRSAALLLAALLTLGSVATAHAAPIVKRIGGADRYETGALLVRSAFAPASHPVVYLASGTGFPDALTGGAAAASAGGALLLTAKNTLPTATRDAIVRLAPAKVVILGGTGSVSIAVEDAVRAIIPAVSRIGGSDRYDTALRTSQRAFTSASTVILASGLNFPDALSAGSLFHGLRAPILLADGRVSLNAATMAEIARLHANRVLVLGGTGAIPASVVSQLTGAGYTVQRLSGADRYATSLAIAKHAYPSSASTVYLTSGTNFPDGLGAGPVAARTDGPVVMVTGLCLPAELKSYLTALNPATIVVVGGAGSVDPGIAALHVCHPLVSATEPNVGTMPSGFTLTSELAPSFDSILPCWKATADYPALTLRKASRFAEWVSETYESGGASSGAVMWYDNEAALLMSQIRSKAQQCVSNPYVGPYGTDKTKIVSITGTWDESVAVVNETFGTLEPYGRAVVIVRRGNLIAAGSYWVYFAEPISNPADATWLKTEALNEASALMTALGG